jgi:hypothetical protein
VNAAMARTLPRLTELIEDERGKVQLAPVAACINFWASSTAVAAYPKLAAAAQYLLTMHATSCASERNWSVWGRVYTKLRASLVVERAAVESVGVCHAELNGSQHPAHRWGGLGGVPEDPGVGYTGVGHVCCVV